MIAAAEETLLRIVPNCKCEVTKLVFDTIVPPFLVGGEDQLRVGQRFV